MIKRKNMRLDGYDYSSCGMYFITICTYNRMHLFGEIVGATLCGRPNNPDKMIEKWLLEIERKFTNIKIDKFTVMPDHIHFVLVITVAHAGLPLPEIVDWYKTMSTNEYIRGVKNGSYPPFDKHIWQRNYYDHIIRNEKEYQQTWQYIDLNRKNGKMMLLCRSKMKNSNY